MKLFQWSCVGFCINIENCSITKVFSLTCNTNFCRNHPMEWRSKSMFFILYVSVDHWSYLMTLIHCCLCTHWKKWDQRMDSRKPVDLVVLVWTNFQFFASQDSDQEDSRSCVPTTKVFACFPSSFDDYNRKISIQHCRICSLFNKWLTAWC